MHLGDRAFVVWFTPGPPAVGTLHEERVVAASADAAVTAIRARYQRWCMVHKVLEARDA